MSHQEKRDKVLQPAQAQPVGPGVATTGAVTLEPSIRDALPYFMLLIVFPLVVVAARYGGWWIAVPFAWLWLANSMDARFGVEERNMDPDQTPASRLLPYNLPLWLWAVLYPVILVFGLWQILVAGHLSLWETLLLALALVSMAQWVFGVSHELVHRRSAWERRVGELLLASISYPHYVTEHVYVHHPYVGTPMDPGSAPKGMDFWRYFRREMASSLPRAWRFEHARLARRHLPVWHYSNPFWRYSLLTGGWYALVWWMGGPWAVLIYATLCLVPVFSMKVTTYIQHYGLQRIRLPRGRFERVQWRHSWSAASRFTNWLYLNTQRHPDHHITSTRPYPLLQHQGADTSPQLPGSYGKMAGLVLSPRRWFETMDPLVDRWRAQFYPEIKDWRAYDSPAFAARPDAFEAIAEILNASPYLARWINRAPELLDSLSSREFTDLDLPDGFGPNPEFELIARRGLTRVYWTLEFTAAEMKEQVADIPVQDAKDAAETLRNWSNDKAFQVAMHTLRGNLSAAEAGTAFSNIAEAAIAGVLAAVVEDFAPRRIEGGVAAMALGDLACGEATLGAELDILFLYDGGPARYYQTLCRRFLAALRALSLDNLLLSPVPAHREERPVLSLADFPEHHQSAGSTDESIDLSRACCVFVSGANIKAVLDSVVPNPKS